MASSSRADLESLRVERHEQYMRSKPAGSHQCNPIVFPDDSGKESEEGSQSQRRVRRKCAHGEYPTIRIRHSDPENGSAEIPEYIVLMTPGNAVTYRVKTTYELGALNFEVVGGVVEVQTHIDGLHKFVTLEPKEGADLSTGKNGIVVTLAENPEVTLAKISLCLEQDNVEYHVKPCASASSDAGICVPLGARVTFHVRDCHMRELTPAFEEYHVSLVSTDEKCTAPGLFDITNYHHVFKAKRCGTSNIVWYNKQQKGKMTPLFQICVTVVDDGTKMPTIRM